jgi:peptide/nickel transport system permease protein
MNDTIVRGRTTAGRRRGASLKAGALILGLLLAAGVAAPWLVPHPPDEQDLARRLERPGGAHPLGCDDLGRDVLSRLLYGARISLPLAILVVGLSAGLGTLLGGLAGLAGGAIDTALMAAADLLLAFPGILLAVAIVAVRGPGLANVVVALCIIGWVGYARLARGETLRVAREPFVEAARAAGAGPARLLGRHVLPLVARPAAVQAALGVGGVVLAEAGLSFLGLGVPPPTATWGGMLRDGAQNLLDAPRLAIAPGALIALAVLGAQMLGEGLGGAPESAGAVGVNRRTGAGAGSGRGRPRSGDGV